MINFDYFTNQLKIPDHPYEILLFRGSRSGKTNESFSLKSQEIEILIKLICMARIQMKQNINCQVTNEKIQT